MTGTVELDQGGQHLLIRFPYREDLVAMVKELPGRRWDPKQKVWRVPSEHAKDVYDACARHLFEFTSEVSSLLAGTLAAAPTAPTEPPASGELPPRQGLLLPDDDAPAAAAASQRSPRASAPRRLRGAAAGAPPPHRALAPALWLSPPRAAVGPLLAVARAPLPPPSCRRSCSRRALRGPGSTAPCSGRRTCGTCG